MVIAGREYDKSGVLRPWWGLESIARFKQRAQCFDDQYSAYTAYGANVCTSRSCYEHDVHLSVCPPVTLADRDQTLQ